MRDSIQSYIEEGMRRRRDRIIVYSMLAVIAVCVVFSIFWLLRAPVAAEETGVCEHELAHMAAHEGCSYSPGNLCGHDCATSECELIAAAIPEVACDHDCATSGCTPIYAEVESGESEGGGESEGTIIRYECSHLCPDGCSYQAAQPATYSCSHEHDEFCGYSEAVACDFICLECAAESDAVDQGVTAALSVKESYLSGEQVQFRLLSSYSHAGTEETSDDETVTIQIKITSTGTQEYELTTDGICTDESSVYYGLETIIVAGSSSGTGKTLYYNPETGVIEYILKSGETFVGYIDFVYPNGTTQNGSTLTLTPTILGDVPGNHVTQDATTTINANFGWDEVKKGANISSLGIVGNGTTQNIYYTLTASNENAGLSTGVVYTDSITITDTITLNNIYFDFSGYELKTAYSTYYSSLEYRLHYSGGYIVLMRVAMSEADFKDYNSGNQVITRVYDETEGNENHVIGFKIVYTITNRNKGSADLIGIPTGTGTTTPYSVQLLYYDAKKLSTEKAENCFFFNTSATEKDKEGNIYSINNHVEFEAKSIFYDKDNPKNPDNEANYCSSEAYKYLFGTSPTTLEKSAYSTSTDSGNALVTTGSVTGSSLGLYSAEYKYFRIVYKNYAEYYEKLYLSDIMVLMASSSAKPLLYDVYDANGEFDASKIEFVGIDVDKAEGMTWDTSKGWDSIELGSLVTDNNLTSSNSYIDRATAYMYKEFNDVPVGAEICIVYRVKATASESATGNTRNYAVASIDIKDTANKYDGFIKSHTIMLTKTTDSSKITLTKTFVDEKGDPVTASDDKNYYYNVGDTVYYAVTITNNSSSDVTLKYLLETWPYSGVYLTGVTGLAEGEALGVYRSLTNIYTSDTYLLKRFSAENAKTISKDDAELQHNSQYYPMYLAIKDMTIPAKNGEINGTRTIIFQGVVYGDVGKPNTVRAYYNDGTDSGNISISYSTAALGINTAKNAYLVEPDKSGGMDWLGETKTNSGYYEGSVMRYEIEVTNNSYTDLILNNVFITDTYDEIFDGKGLTLGTYKDASGYVLVEYADGTVNALNIATDAVSVAGSKSYYLDGRTLTAAVSDAGLESGETMKFIFFLAIDSDVKAKYDELSFTDAHAWGIKNEVKAEGWAKENPTSADKVSSSDTHYAIMKERPEDRSAVVSKTHYETLYGLAEASGQLTYTSFALASEYSSLKTGDYVAYEISIGNISKEGTDAIELYGFKDVLPDGTEFYAITDKSSLTSTAGTISSYSTTDSTTVLLQLKSADGSSKIVSLSAKIKYDSVARTLSIDFNESISISRNETVSIIVIAKVTDTMEHYVNNGGYFIDGSVQTDSNDYETTNGKKYVYDSAEISGPVYYVGTEKTVKQYNIGGDKWWDVSGDSYVSILPKYQIRWNIKLQNGANSTTALTSYTVVDILPAEFKYVAGTSTLGGVGIGDPAIVPFDDGRKQLTWTINTPLAPGAAANLTFVSEWDGVTSGSENGIYGIYQNQASLVIDGSYKIEGSVSGELDKENNTVTDYAQVNMLGAYGTTSYKTIENVTATSPYYEQSAAGVNSTGSIFALAGDMVKYTLNITNQSGTEGAGYMMKDTVIIDTLPQYGDVGVVNKAIARNSAFNVTFSSATTVSVELKSADGTKVPVTDYEYEFKALGAAGPLSVDDWAGGGTGWSGTKSGADAIRITLGSGVLVEKGDTIVVTFTALVAGETGKGVVLPSSGDIAWNSFGYAYNMSATSELSPRLYAEPIKVGVEIPYATIEISKTVIDEKSKTAVTKDTTEFSFNLYRKLTGDTEWSAAENIRYVYEGENTVYVTDANGVFTLKHGQKLTLYAPAGYMYKVSETVGNDAYTSLTSDYVTEVLNKDGKASVSWRNERKQDKWDVTLRKESYTGAVMEGVKFTLSKLGGDGEYVAVTGEVATDASGLIKFTGLEAGTYKITEVETLKKYALVDDIVFTLPAGTASEESPLPEGVTIVPVTGDADFLVTVVNYLNYELPEAGGGGVWPWLLAGMLLIAGAGVSLARKRQSRKRRRAS